MDNEKNLRGQAILTINAGSSSIKFSVFLLPQLNQILVGQIDDIGGDARFTVRWHSDNNQVSLNWPNATPPKKSSRGFIGID